MSHHGETITGNASQTEFEWFARSALSDLILETCLIEHTNGADQWWIEHLSHDKRGWNVVLKRVVVRGA